MQNYGAMFNTLGAAFNVVAAILVLRGSLRNYTIFEENLKITEKIGKAMRMMKQLRDLLDGDLEDPLTVGDADKEGKHGIH